MIGAMLDMSQMRKAETALRQSEERSRAMLETIEAAFAIIQVRFDADDSPVDYRFIEANPAFERQAGVDLRGKWVTEFAPDWAVLVRSLWARRQNRRACQLRELCQGVRALVRSQGGACR